MSFVRSPTGALPTIRFDRSDRQLWSGADLEAANGKGPDVVVSRLPAEFAAGRPMGDADRRHQGKPDSVSGQATGVPQSSLRLVWGGGGNRAAAEK